MSEIATPPPNTLQLPNYGGSLNPNFRVPEFHPMEMPRPYVAPLGEIVGQALKAYDAERAYRDQAPARDAAAATNEAYLSSIGRGATPGDSGSGGSASPGVGSRALASLGHLFDGSLGQHASDAPPTDKPLANLANPFFDSNRGSFQAGPNGASWAPFHRNPAQDAKTNEDTRRLRIGNDAAEAAAQARPVTPIQVHDPATGGVAPLSSSGGATSSSSTSSTAGGVDPSLVDFIKAKEGYEPKAVADGAQHSIGWGTRATSPDETISKDEAESRLQAELAMHAKNVDAAFAAKGVAPTPGQRNALISFDFNTGRGADVIGTSPDLQTVASRMALYTKASGQTSPGLVNRRQAELGLFNGSGGNTTQANAPGPVDVAVAPPALSSLAGVATPAAMPLANLPLPPLAANVPTSRPLAFLPSPLTLADTPQTSAGGAPLANLSADLSLPAAAAGNALALANVPVASFDAGPAVSGAENPFPSRPTVAAPANAATAATAAGPTVLDPAVYGYRHGFMRPGPNGAKYFEATQDGSGDTLSPYVASPTQGSPVIDPATGKAVPGVLMVGNQIVRQPGGANAAAAGAMNLDDLSPEQRLQARALATDLFGKKAGADPASVNLVADQLRAGKSREEIRGLAGQVSPMLGVAGKYNSDPQVKTYLNTVANYQTVKDIAEKPADKITKQDDLSLLFAYVKADNPTMGVTEGSFKVAAAQGTFGDQVQKMVNQLTNTNQTLTQQQREGFRDAALSKLLGQRETYSLARDRYQGIASYVGADPDVAMGADVKPFTEADVARIKGGAAPAVPAASPATPAVSTAAAAVRVNSQAEYDALPSGTVFEDSAGKKGRKR